MATMQAPRRLSDARYRRALKAYGRKIDTAFASHMRDVLLGIEKAKGIAADQGLDEQGRPLDHMAGADEAFWMREAERVLERAERIPKPIAVIEAEAERVHRESVRANRAALIRAGASRPRVAARLGVEVGELIGVNMRLTIAELAAQENWVAQNLQLVKTIPQRQVQAWAGWMSDAIADGKTYRTLEAEILSRTDGIGPNAEWIAERIGRDQVNKAQAQISQTFAQEVGSDWYIWRTAADDGRVRESHEDVADRYWRFSDPAPNVGVDGAAGNPGEPIMCRCRAELWIPPDLLGDPPGPEPEWGAPAR
jgi:uncharacterized protein with gpF-like domain